MSGRRIAACLIGAAALFPAAARAEDQPWSLEEAVGAPDGLTLRGSVRLRYEALSGQFRPGLDESDDLVTIRSTLFAEYDAGPVRIGAELFDSRAYDADAGSSVGTGEVNAVELVQAYIAADLGDALGEGGTTSLLGGRFTMDLGSRRLVGRNNFRNTTNAFTGLRLDHRSSNFDVTAFYALPQQRLPDDKLSILDNDVEWDRESFDLQLWGIFGTVRDVAAGGSLDLYIFGLDEDDGEGRPTRDRNLITPGFRFFRDPRAGAWDFEIEAALQFGRISESTVRGAARQDVRAGTVHAEVGHQFAGPWQPRLSLEYDYASGDDVGGGFGRFDPLYGPRRPDWGPTGIYGPFGRANISSPGLRVEVKPDARWDGFLSYRAIWLDSASDSLANTGVRDPAGRSGRFAGHQIEGRTRYWLIRDSIRLEIGGAVLFPGRFLESAPNASGHGTTLYGYGDITFTF